MLNLIEPDAVFETTYKTIIEGYEWDHLRERDRHKANNVIKAKPDNMEEFLQKLQGKTYNEGQNKLYEDKVTSLVPPLIKKIYPRLKDETYKMLRNDIAFLKKTALFCEDCILGIQQSQENNLKSQKQSLGAFYGTGRLKPENVKFRFTVRLRLRCFSNCFQHTLKAIQGKEDDEPMTNFIKYKGPLDPRSFTSTRQSNVQSNPKSPSTGLPFIFGELKSMQTLKTK